jgi:hypothetical protein
MVKEFIEGEWKEMIETKKTKSIMIPRVNNTKELLEEDLFAISSNLIYVR